MKGLRALPIIVLSLFFNIACSRDDVNGPLDDGLSPIKTTELSLEEKVSLLEDYEIPKSEITNIVKKFELIALDSLKLRSTSSESEYQIGDKFYFSEEQSKLRVTKDETDDDQLAVYSVKMDKGYALVSADMRHIGVIAFISNPNGDSEDLTKNIGVKEMQHISLMSALYKIKKFNAIKDSLKQSAHEKLESNLSLRSTVNSYEDIMDKWLDFPETIIEDTQKKYPLIKTQWDQGVPYNSMMPSCEVGPGYKFNTGCGVVAIAQAIAHCEPKMNVYVYDMDWINIKKYPSLKAGKTPQNIINKVSALMKWIGEKANSTPIMGTSLMGTGVKKIESVLPMVGMKCDGARGWNWGVISASLKNGRIVHVTGRNSSDDGHAWLMDGYIQILYKGENTLYVHCNFGWNGSGDGYYEIENDLDFNTPNSTFDRKFTIQANICKK